MIQQELPMDKHPGNHLVQTWIKIKQYVTSNVIFSVSLFAAIISSFFQLPRWEYIDFKVIICLFELMIVVDAFDQFHFLQYIATKVCKSCKTERALTMALCLTSFLVSMLLTNDVTLLAIVPILIIISKKSSYDIVIPCVLVTIAANLGSSMTPFGNPQNLFLFSFYKMSTKTFLGFSLPLCILSLVLLVLLGFIVKSKKIQFEMEDVMIQNKKGMGFYSLLLILVILSVFNLIPYLAVFPIVILSTLITNKKLLKQANYQLIFTFVFIFVAVGNVSHIPQLNQYLSDLVHTPKATYIYSLLLSQIISNVPATIAIAPFSSHAQALYYGVNIGGLGTPVASLASIIAYSLYSSQYGENKAKFLIHFTVLNFSCLAVLGIAGFLMI